MVQTQNKFSQGLCLLLLSGACFSQDPEPANVEVQETPEEVREEQSASSVRQTLIFGRPEQDSEDTDSMIEVVEQIPSQSEIAAELTVQRAIADGINQYQESINDIESQGGVWSEGLAQELSAIGTLQAQQGAHELAVDSFTRAMQVNRINYGLDNLQQVPLVEQLINSHLALGQWDQADKYHSYLYYTQRKAFGPNDPRMLPVLERLANWSLSAFNSGYGEATGIRLFTALYSFRAASEIVSSHFGQEDQRYVRYLKDMADTAYLVYTNPQLMGEAPTTNYNELPVIYRDRYANYDPMNPQGFRDGLEALEQIVSHYSEREDTKTEYAEALIDLADWHLMFDRRRTASGYYREAYTIFAGLQNGEDLIQQHFSSVKPLPELTQRIQQQNIESRITEANSRGRGRDTGFVSVVFDVTRNGSVVNLEILADETEVNSRVLTLLRRKVRSTKFRPMVVDGELTRSSDNRFRYRYWY